MNLTGYRMIVLLLLATGLRVVGQVDLMVEGAKEEKLESVTVSIYEGENSHAATTEVVPVPRNKPVWTGVPNRSGKIVLPGQYFDGRRGLVVAKGKSQMAFLILGIDAIPIVVPMPLVLSTYKKMTVSCQDGVGQPCEFIPVFAVDAGRLLTHHLG